MQIGPGILLAEIQQTSDATLRIYDFDRVDDEGKPRPLHLEKAMEAIDFNVYPTYKIPYEKISNQSNLIKKCEYFTVNYLELDKPLKKDFYDLDSFVIYICLDGSADIMYYENEKEILQKGETVMIPAEITEIGLVPDEQVKLLEVFIEGESVTDRTNNILEQLF